MTYSAIMLVDERNEIKDKRRFKEISETQYTFIYREQRNTFYKLYNYPGSRLYDLVKDKNLMEMNPKSRNFVLDGLTHYTEVCIRLNKHDKAREICEKVINQMPSDYHKPFIYKLNKLENIIKDDINDEKDLADYRNYGGDETDLSIKFKQALERKYNN